MRMLVLAGGCLLLPALAHAHPGHPHTSGHADHLALGLGFAAVVLGVALLHRWVVRSSQSRHH